MLKKSVFVLMFSSLSAMVMAQGINIFDLGLSIGAGRQSRSMSLQAFHTFKWKAIPKLGVNVGLKITGVHTNFRSYNCPDCDDNVSILAGKKPKAVSTLNMMVGAEYYICKRVLIGFNLDILGVLLRATKQEFEIEKNGNITQHEASPTDVNLRTFGYYNKGTLSSEYYVGCRVSNAFVIKAGISPCYTQYDLLNEQAAGLNYDVQAARFANLAFINLTYKIFDKGKAEN